jgi:hypothetical protein
MSDVNFPESLIPRLRTAQIITVSMIVGVVVMAAVLFFLRSQNPPPPPPVPLVSYLGYVFAAVCLGASVLVPNVVLANFRKQIAKGQQPNSSNPWPRPPEDAGTWMALYQTTLIIGLALLEGPTFFLLIAFFLEGQPVSLGVAGGLLACMALRFPTRDGVMRWIETQRELVERERQDLGG